MYVQLSGLSVAVLFDVSVVWCGVGVGELGALVMWYNVAQYIMIMIF